MIASVFARRLPWLTITSEGTPVEPEVGINAARSASAEGAGENDCAGQGWKVPSIAGRPFAFAQSNPNRLATHIALARALLNSASPEFASARPSTRTGTNPANMAPR